MTSERAEPWELIAELPDDQVLSVLADMRRRVQAPQKDRPWPRALFGTGESIDGRTDNARRVNEILAEGFGAFRS